MPYVYHGDLSEDALREAGIAAKDGFYYDSEGKAIQGAMVGSSRNSWEKTVSKMSSYELDAELADVYAREFGMSKSELEEEERRKWAKAEIGMLRHPQFQLRHHCQISQLRYSILKRTSWNG